MIQNGLFLEQNDWSNLGMHTLECPLVVLGCTDSEIIIMI